MRIVGLLLVSLLVATPGLAEVPADYTRSGFYLQAAGALAFDSFSSEVTSLNAAPDLDFSLGGGVIGAVGYRIVPALGVEFEGTWVTGMSASSFTYVNGNPTPFERDASLLFYTLNGRFHWCGFFQCEGSRVQPYFKFGIGGVRAELEDQIFASPNMAESKNGFGMRAGGGLDIYPTEHLYAFVDAAFGIGVTDVLKDMGVFTLGIGVGYRF